MNLSPHEQNHSKKTKHLPSLCNTIMTTMNLIDEAENRSINQSIQRTTSGLAVR